MAKAYSYIRMSTKEQLHGDSLRRQLQRTAAYAREKGLELVERYDDWGVSAYRGKNASQGALARFLDAITDGRIQKGSYLLIESMDRLSRDKATAAFALLTEIINAGIIVVTLDDKQEYSQATLDQSHAHLFIAIGAMIRSHEESRRKAGLLAETWQEKRRKLVDKGEILTSRIPSWLRVNKSKDKIEVIPDRAKLVREMFELSCSGFGTYSIAALFNTRGEEPWGKRKSTRMTAPQGEAQRGIWRESYIKKVLTNRAVLGEFQPNRMQLDETNRRIRVPEGPLLRDYYPRVIDDVTFRESAAAMERRRTGGRGRKGRTYANILTGLLHCARCGSTMRYIDKGRPPKGGQYLRCSLSVTGGGCDPRMYRYSAVELTILSVLEQLDIEKILGGESMVATLQEKKHARESLQIDVEALDRKIAHSHRKFGDYDGPVPHTLLRDMAAWEKGKVKVEAEISRLDAEIDDLLSIDAEKRREVISDLLKRLRDEPEAERKAMARRAMAAELHRMIELIAIRLDANSADEIMASNSDWKSTYGVRTQSDLEEHIRVFGFELSIRYRNGLQTIARGTDQHTLKLRWSPKHADLRLLRRRGA